MTRRSDAVRVFLVDDSAVSRFLLRRTLQADGFEVVGEAHNGREALARIPGVRPDVVLMDVVMPGMDGLETTRQLMASSPCPIVVVSELAGRHAGLSFEALQAGAVEVARKPTATSGEAELVRLLRRVRLVAGVPVVTRRRRTSVDGTRAAQPAATTPDWTAGPSVPPLPSPARAPAAGSLSLACVGTSTGGPPALATLLGALAPRLEVPVLVVQHMARGFIASLATWLSDATSLPVCVAGDRELPVPGVVYLAPDGHDLVVERGRLRLNDLSAKGDLGPSVDSLFHSVAASDMASSTVAALLTGMGRDGASGLLALRRAGGWTIAEAESSCVVYGMPKAAVEIGAACEILSLPAVGPRIQLLTAAQPLSRGEEVRSA